MTVNRESNAFVIYQDDTVAGHVAFRDHDGERIFFHTEIGEDFGGRGLASQLIDAALDATSAEGLGVVAVCPVVKSRLEKHPEVFDGRWRKPSISDLDWLKDHT